MKCFSKTRQARLRRGKGQTAAVLLEVVLALVLFVAAAAIITGGINSSMEAAERQKLQLHAANLATTVLSELHLGIRPLEGGSAVDFEPPFTNWTCELAITSGVEDLVTGSGLSTVEVIIRHKESELVFRQAQMLQPGSAPAATNEFEVGIPE